MLTHELPYKSCHAPPELDLHSLRSDAEGISGVFGSGDHQIAVYLANGPNRGALAAIIELGPDGLDRIQAVTQLWRALHKHAASDDPRLTPQQKRRMRFMLQATDGHRAGATYRQIAAGVFGASRVAADAWKTSALRDTTIALVKDGMAMIKGGYRKLLTQRRRK